MMNLPAFPRHWFRLPARNTRRSSLHTGIEPLESRIAPAMLMSPTQISFLDKSGQLATVTISKPLFTAANVNKVFTFDTGSVDGTTGTEQQLELFNVVKLGPAASTMAITISATTGAVDVGYIKADGIDLGAVSVGGDLGRIHAGLTGTGHPAVASLTVNSLGVDGISTQLAGGNLVSLFSGPVPSITINGDLNQASIGVGGGSLGVIGALTVTGDIIGGAAAFSGSVRTQGGFDTIIVDGSIIGGGGTSSGVIGTAGRIVSVTVDGSVLGGDGAFSGAILATGSITYAQINGDLRGGSGANSGELGSANVLQTVVIESSVQGGTGNLSGTILAGHGINSVTITNGLVGNNGANSGEIGTGGNIGTVTVGHYGLVTPVIITGGQGGALPQDGTYQGVEDGQGADSGTIHAAGDINSVTIGGSLNGYYTAEEGGDIRPAIHHRGISNNNSFYGNGNGSGVISAGGSITSVDITSDVYDGGIVSGASIGTVTIAGTLADESGIHAHNSITSVSVNASGENITIARPGVISRVGFTPGEGDGIDNSEILADIGGIGQILAGGNGYTAIESASIAAGGTIGLLNAVGINGYALGIANTTVYAGAIESIIASSDNENAIQNTTFTVVQGISSIEATNYDSNDFVTYGIYYSTFQAGGSIGTVTATSQSTGGAIANSGFNAGGNIGEITAYGGIEASTFVAGIKLGSSFANSTTGTFTSTDATAIGFGSSTSTVAALLGPIMALEGGGGTGTGTGTGFINSSTFLAGVHGAGIDHKFGTKDDAVAVGSTIAPISAPDGISTSFFESGNIGATTAGPMSGVTYISTDSAVAAAGIGPITIVATYIDTNDDLVGHRPQVSGTTADGIYNSTFISNSGIGNINVTLNGDRIADDNSGISSSSFAAGHAIGTITVTNNLDEGNGYAYGITGTTFATGAGGYGGVGDIHVSLTDSGPDGNTVGIYQTTIDGSVCACMSANLGSIYVSNADTSGSAAGIVDSTFRTHGSIGAITALLPTGSDSQPAIRGSVFSAYGSIGDITTVGSILADEGGPSQFLAGYDIGTGLTFGGQSLAAHSLALQAGQSVGNVSVSGNFEGSDIIASINPGAGYVFGADANTNVGVGGTIGTVIIGSAFESDGSPFVSDGARSHAIEAANFPGSDGGPYVTAFGYNGYVPVVLYVDGGAGDVRITNLTQSTG
jgi:hypothetical protein